MAHKRPTECSYSSFKMRIIYISVILVCTLGLTVGENWYEACLLKTLPQMTRKEQLYGPVCAWSTFENRFETFATIADLVSAVSCGKDFEFLKSEACDEVPIQLIGSEPRFLLDFLFLPDFPFSLTFQEETYEMCMAGMGHTLPYRPLCGWSSTEKTFKTFQTVREFYNSGMCGKDFTFVRRGRCEDYLLFNGQAFDFWQYPLGDTFQECVDSKMVPYSYAPVCAWSPLYATSKTFKNKESFQIEVDCGAEWMFMRDGACEKDTNSYFSNFIPL